MTHEINQLSLGLPPTAYGQELVSTDQLYDAASTVTRELQVTYNALNQAIWQAHASAAMVTQLCTTQFEDFDVYEWACEARDELSATLRHLRKSLRCFDNSRSMLFGTLDHLKPMPFDDPAETTRQDPESPGGPEGGGGSMADPTA